MKYQLQKAVLLMVFAPVCVFAYKPIAPVRTTAVPATQAVPAAVKGSAAQQPANQTIDRKDLLAQLQSKKAQLQKVMSTTRFTRDGLRAHQEQVKKVDDKINALKKMSSQYVTTEDNGQTYKAYTEQNKVNAFVDALTKKLKNKIRN